VSEARRCGILIPKHMRAASTDPLDIATSGVLFETSLTSILCLSVLDASLPTKLSPPKWPTKTAPRFRSLSTQSSCSYLRAVTKTFTRLLSRSIRGQKKRACFGVKMSIQTGLSISFALYLAGAEY
jgi:hypothetical protein